MGFGQVDGGSGADRFQCYQSFLEWDVRDVTGTLNFAVASIYVVSDSSDTDFTIEMRQQAYSEPLATSDWVASASLGGLTRVASRSASGLTVGAYNALTSDATMLTTLAAIAGTSAVLTVNISSSRQAGNNSPTGDEFINIEASATDGDAGGTATDPRLVIDVLAPASNNGLFFLFS